MSSIWVQSLRWKLARGANVAIKEAEISREDAPNRALDLGALELDRESVGRDFGLRKKQP